MTDPGEPSGRVEPHHILMQARMRGVPNPDPTAFLAFYLSHKSYYVDSWRLSADCEAEIMVTLSDPGGGTHGEFSIKFGHFENPSFGNGPPTRGQPWMRLGVFEDALQAMVQQADFLTALAAICKTTDHRTHSPTPDEVEGLLRGLGYRDVTRYTAGQGD